VFRPDDTLQTLDVGSLLPLHASALGKVLLAYDSTAAAVALRGECERYTRRTITTPPLLARALVEVREAGWGADIEEMTVGEAGVAAPIRGYGGLVVGSIGLSGPVERICDTRRRPLPKLVGYVRDAARAVSRDLGAARR
jgi:DNA-binding IclR family transcriptional regulator